MSLQQVIDSRVAVNFLSLLARVIPTHIGYPICDLLADWMASRRDSKVTQAVRANQWVVRGANLDDDSLNLAVKETLRNNAHELYNLYHYLERPQAFQKRIHFSPTARRVLERPEHADRGLVILGLHLSSFDFILRYVCKQGFKAMILTIPDPRGGRRLEYEMRKKTGMHLVPASVSALRSAVKHLEQGGMVLTGLDHPVEDSKYQPRFFGKPACLPTHYVPLALKAGVPMLVMAAIQQADRHYQVLGSEPIEVEHYTSHEEEIIRNAEKVLKQAERFIRLAPQQWNVPVPVWPTS